MHFHYFHCIFVSVWGYSEAGLLNLNKTALINFENLELLSQILWFNKSPFLPKHSTNTTLLPHYMTLSPYMTLLHDIITNYIITLLPLIWFSNSAWHLGCALLSPSITLKLSVLEPLLSFKLHKLVTSW